MGFISIWKNSGMGGYVGELNTYLDCILTLSEHVQRLISMCPLANKKRIYIKDIIGQHLALRHLADKLFDYIDSLKDTDVIVDFCGVHTTSRSFM
ncbi:MAG: hypothetical protein C4B59_16395 [Candidatus Methanogaster sp.]|uniref:Uncharacterized protein n=1 Tax=Candidatus Methanogaster sp. TaxID=3386292 RepID=A0AC61KY40_9EURY|nr:MAG: hypothetical protein C4B59_16395 [ANME-2 cluster archaeon]